MATNYKSDQMAISRMHGWHVYVLSLPGFSKIGTAARVFTRVPQLQNGNPHPLEIEAIWHFKCRNEARAVEAAALNEQGLNRLPRRDWCECGADLAIAAVEYTIKMLASDARRLTNEEWATA